MRILLVIVSLVLWIAIIIFTAEQELAGDGCDSLGYPRRFVETCHNDFGKNVETWHSLGIVLNILLFILIYMPLNQLRKKLFIKKAAK